MCQCKKEFTKHNSTLLENYNNGDTYDKAVFAVIDNYLNIELYSDDNIHSEIEIRIEFCPFCGQQKE